MPDAHPRTLSLREQNRTTLERQLLRARANLPVGKAVEQLVGLQAQLARPPFVGLWTRLDNFKREDLARELEAKRIVKATFVRATLHLLTADDYVRFRATLQPVLTSALAEITRQRGAIVDVPKVVEAARAFIQARPRSFAEITDLLTGLEPDGDPGAMRYAVRTHLPMVQVATQTAWSFPGNPKFTLAASWLGRTLPDENHAPDLVKRYLAAFGPATIKDFETWSYLGNVAPVVDSLRSELVTYRDERGRELFDLPGLPILSADAEAPVRFLPEFDNLLLAHQDRTRFVPTAYRKRVYLPGLRIAATVLIDGFVAAAWTSERIKQTAIVRITPFAPFGKDVAAQVTEEAERLARFIEPDAHSVAVRIGPVA